MNDTELRLAKPDVWDECWELDCHERSTAYLACDGIMYGTTCPRHAVVALAMLRKGMPFGFEWTLSEIRR